MKKKILCAAGVAVAMSLSACSGGSADAGDTLNIYGWEGEIPEILMEQFEEETGIKINFDAADSNETMISKLAAGGAGYDVVLASQYAVQQMVGQELLAPLDHSQLEGFENISDTFADPIYDPGNEYSIPWVWGTTGLMYNETCTAGEEITKWESLFDEKWSGKVLMLDNMLAAYIAALQVNGYDGNSTDEDEIAEATQTLIDQKKLLAGYNSTNYYDLVVAGDVCMSEAWGGTSTAKAVADNDDVHFVVPEEGGSLWVDGFSLAAGAPNEEGAIKFFNFILRPEIAAEATNEAGMASANNAALEHVTDEGLLSNAAVYASEEEVENADFVVDPGSAMQFYQDGWTRVKAS